MRRAVLLVATMALAILAASGVAQAIINGEPDGNSHPYVGWASTEEWACSGTLISPTVFLTAGHCTEDWGTSTVYVTFDPEADFGPVVFDPDGVFDPGNAYTGTAHTYPGYGAGGGFPDVGVLVLDQPVTTANGYGKLPQAGIVDTLHRGQRLTAVGYGVRDFETGGGHPPQGTDFAVRYRATVEFWNTEDVVFGNNVRLADVLFKFTNGNPGTVKEGTCYGDSGGPLFPGDQRTVLGVTSRGYSSVCAGKGLAQRIDLPQVLSWISSFE